MAFVLMLSMFVLGACDSNENTSDKCVVCKEFGNETVYKLDGKDMEIGYPCLECGYVKDPIEVIKCDFTVSADESNAVTRIQYENPGVDLVIGVKKGYYDKIFVGDSERSVHVVAEDGTQVVVAQCNGGANGVTFENFYFYTDPTSRGTMSQVKFETAGEHAYWSNVVIKNCLFEGKSKIDSSWKNGVIENMTVIGTTFRNLTGWGAGAGSACAIFTDENWGETIIKDCVFDNIDYAAIRFGRVSTEGYFLIENCFFREIGNKDEYNSKTKEDKPDGKPDGNACIMFSSKNSKLAGDDSVDVVNITLEVNNCVFADSSVFSYSKSSNAKVNSQFIIGANTWLSIPTSISGATQYDIRQQLLYEGEI